MTIAAGINRPVRTKSGRRPRDRRDGDWGTVSGPIEDQQLVLNTDGFRHHGTRAAGAGKSGDRRQQMQMEDGQIAHRAIVARSRRAHDMLTNVEFAITGHGAKTITMVRRP
jgi:hypothetical protein